MGKIIVSDDNIHIQESYKTSKKEIPSSVDGLIAQYPDCAVIKTRWRYSLIMEWVAHNFLYQINYKRDRTADVDLNTMPWYMQLLYCVCGTAVWLFTK